MQGRPPGIAAPAQKSSAVIGGPWNEFSLGVKLLTGVLSLTAGSVDVIGFLGLGGLLSAHITGNLVILAAHIVSGGTAQLAAILSVPVFMLVLCLAVALKRAVSTRCALYCCCNFCCSPVFSPSASQQLPSERSNRRGCRDVRRFGNGGAERARAGFTAWRAGNRSHNNQHRALHN
jgi:Protein of unknown function (DUF1275)